MDLAAIIDWQGEPSEPQVIVMPEYRGGVYDSQAGIGLVTSSFKGQVRTPSIKRVMTTTERAESARRGKETGCHLCTDVRPRGYLAEAPASHVAIVKDGRFLTPMCDAARLGLPGKSCSRLASP